MSRHWQPGSTDNNGGLPRVVLVLVAAAALVASVVAARRVFLPLAIAAGPADEGDLIDSII